MHLNSSSLAFSDVSNGSPSFGQTGYVFGLYMFEIVARIYHVLDWVNCKQKHVEFYSNDAEILAAATSSDRGALMAESIQDFQKATVKLLVVLRLDPYGLYYIITTLHEGAKHRLRMRESFENWKYRECNE